MSDRPSGEAAAIGLRSHSGWAALVALAGPVDAPTVVERRRIEIADLSIPGSVQPYHAAEELSVPKAEQLLDRCSRGARRLAHRALDEVIGLLGARGHDVVACGLLLASGRPLPALGAVLQSHALIHTADGEHFREALTHAALECGLPMVTVKEREAFERGALALHLPVPKLQGRVGEMGRSLGPPWRQDEKLATLVAWLALSEARSPRP